ncbi:MULTISPECIES: heme exporter protein CcmB [Alloalcanivorax]|jgi:heme exporter protein B|uniref:Heme exporter protein B n=2 Tax=Alloalcanivorax TaxID=3020832 RepID=A0A9Q3W4N0_9GAMM|nr:MULTISPECIES: heme exporter protein CcmB [Alloalcanivorax]ERS15000.1 Heme exporter protein B [Alcanivorax sp. PN-3]KYZ87085.1 heme exporter protein CcmB [Alcanivorax sp. KX64203]MBA4723358.1 heme exporter protein CcmB [Alcanivorax sp.]ARB45269.1 heme transporter [Alloalcanivorax xenomutans]MCE7510500.1 heme exporter protein CcmB [Alloalcanivorax xenomutans]
MSGPWWATLRRELTLIWRSPADMVQPLFFFMVVVSLFPLGLSPKPELLALVAPGVVWVAALLAVMLSLDGLFRRDQESGALDQMLTAPVVSVLPVSAKLLAHWLLTGLPLALMAPLLGYMMQLPVPALATLTYSVLLGTPTLTVIGAIGAALTVGLNRGGILLALLILPLYVPVLVFGAGVVRAAVDGSPTQGLLAVLGALLALALSLGPLAVAMGLRISAGD